MILPLSTLVQTLVFLCGKKKSFNHKGSRSKTQSNTKGKMKSDMNLIRKRNVTEEFIVFY
jgi:hypothetical protein